MPLLEHFHKPLKGRYPWESFHTDWAVEIQRLLNRTLPRRFIAHVQVHLGRQVEADVAEFDERFPQEHNGNPDGHGVAVATYAPPAVKATIEGVFPDDIEVQVKDTRDDMRLVAVIELVSPANKDGPDERRAFAAKTAAYLQRRVGVVTLDIVTESHSNLHDEFAKLMGLGAGFTMAEGTNTYAASYRPIRRGEADAIEYWEFPLTVGQPLPTIPMYLRAIGTIPLDLEKPYTEACVTNHLD